MVRFMATALERDVGDHLAESPRFTNHEVLKGKGSWQGQGSPHLAAALGAKPRPSAGCRTPVGTQPWVSN